MYEGVVTITCKLKTFILLIIIIVTNKITSGTWDTELLPWINSLNKVYFR